MLGCLKAFLKSGVQRKFYDLGRVNYWGPQSAKNVDFHFDEKRKLSAQQIIEFQQVPRGRKSLRGHDVVACGGGDQQLEEDVGEELLIAGAKSESAPATQHI